ncbi:CheR family methyltransferase [Roseateles amylovorans]|uniref:Protein-glutamate O-methyltransferase CheR n=1 Tax=Roseateles amylovorans TaxID=2978473 RepID=A0ABY6AWR5_9BURK|nr:protein-glutamate O-methyltransferase CheR [Roseateles amylovorans]UXH77348.1 protein-glutamate O-methyltransferase CheR [Roseateles amylovorans]
MTPPQAVDPLLMTRWRALLAARLGLQFDPRQERWLADRLVKLAGETEIASYLSRLEQHPRPADTDRLAAELTVGETFFFRHAEQFDALRLALLPAWMRRPHPPLRRLRALSAGCATGEEAYTLAITLHRAGLTTAGIDWEVTAFDLNPEAITKAGAARYGEWSLRATPPSWRDLWFRHEDTTWTPLPSLRQRVRFEQRQIAQPDAQFWAPGSFDVIFCRNMLMYLDGASLQSAVRHLTTALAPGGALFLGHAETLRGLTDDLALRQAQGCFFYQSRSTRETETGDTLWPFSPAPSPCLSVPPASSAAVPAHAAGAKSASPAQATISGPAPWADAWPMSAPGALEEDRASIPAARTGLLDEALLLVETGQINDGLRACAELMGGPAPAELQAEVYFIQALAMEERGELSAAEWHHQRAAAKDAAFAMPHLRLGLLARRRGEVVAARRELHHAHDLLARESTERLRRFGGGFERDALRQLCRAEIGGAQT